MKAFLFLFFVCIYTIQAQQSTIKEIKKFQKKLNEEFKNPTESPLTKEGLANFTELSFFPIDTAYVVKAKIERIKDAIPFKMQTTTDRLPIYVLFAKAHFILHGNSYSLEIYRNENLMNSAVDKDYIFLPFTDETNGKTTYQGGRYIDLKVPKGDELIIDFNRAYNPYCAYNGKFSCPIPPKQNHLNTYIEAGVKKYK
ncbi:DUF1684 domain-containing protein [Namhaeicola litoreus]|uniref:DUF1684 domain-containing protein n=1 Tax=Namhaeicola litoreus TaxID=1052145 RepID=A0ABW3Y7N4_9FLAO